ncbi:alcohol dehydrogenase catalytic domain-containing protein [Conexibacter arvalis]|uniref:Threonine dehydrogenase-like Zn-dependent dehydrogenase n=1 Tax=Conexibacter arvalis TaxID=912552 RepID=A0A840IFB2_9ACTN|nr:alcohol dehydrogenase catalytic domain-containing protein [Conexibacter arvalis]MBB4662754.1 threonine dehydrogenase-like Zn-dependent dehydrogenase [Conexibacter arvalis]
MSSFISAGAGADAPQRPRATVRVFELHGPGSVLATRRALPHAGTLLRVETTGVCGTDHHIWAGAIEVPVPLLLGHEVIGRVERLPADHGLVAAAQLAAGDRVLIAPGVPCGACAGCTGGDRCLDRPCYGLTMTGDGLTGGFSPYMELLPGTRLFHIPERAPAERLVFAEPMACVLSALRKAFGERFAPKGAGGLVLGFGVIGLCSAVALAAAGAIPTVVEFDARRRALAAALGFATLATSEEAAAVASSRDGFDLVVDAAGTPAAFAGALRLLGWGGTLVELGNFADLGEVAIKPSDICLRDLRIVGSGETFYDDFPAAIRLVVETPVEIEHAITDVHRFDALEDPSELFTARAAGKAMVSFT